ncbi:putative spermidine/putrescine transport system substrate-binding protein [Bosea sp. AK1]|uniref:ABC transporter substrate-binding protein n=1 Tax=Bosea sp. AK1 TaxID=2587160 RepID=UPI001172C939|nr:extracellular solute-binding protein [Bosea sp. AK1]TQI65314.1 putative spermidine/putrescine transport system substrate-binding protein [Bosea sp. AK1]
MSSLSRRSFNHLLLGAAAGSACPGFASEAAAQTGGRLVIGTWGGDTQTMLDKFVVKPKVQSAGVSIAYDAASEAPRKTKLLAERPLPRGTLDVGGFQPPSTFELQNVGALEELDSSRVSKFNSILPNIQSKYAIPQFYTARVILYNSQKVTNPPKSYADLWKPEYAGRVGIVDIQYQSTIESAALTAGGAVGNYEPGKARLLELKRQGVKVYPSNEALGQGLASGEVWVCIMWQARGVKWQDAGLPISIVYPEEGVALSVYEYAMPKNARNKEAAYLFLNGLLDEGAQIGHAREHGYIPSRTDVELPADLKARIQIPDAFANKLLLPDLAYLRENDSQLKDWWDRVFKG